MRYDEYVKSVQQNGMMDSREHTEVAITATLEVLGQRLAGGEASNLAAQLPAELTDTLDRHAGEAEAFDVDEFFRRVAEREGRGCSTEQAQEHARTVLSTLASSVSAGEIEDIRSQLPAGYAFLMI